jgi:shikimate kinase
MNIILIGFMGSGKSSIAMELSKRMNYMHIETDRQVLKLSRRDSINDIFLLDGECVFRELEIEVAKKLQDKDKCIVSTGGGMVINKLSIDYLKKNGKVVYLQTSFGEVEKRLKDDVSRPLFKDKMKAQKLFQFRKHLYEEYADVVVDTDAKSIDEITNIIIQKI